MPENDGGVVWDLVDLRGLLDACRALLNSELSSVAPHLCHLGTSSLTTKAAPR